MDYVIVLCRKGVLNFQKIAFHGSPNICMSRPHLATSFSQ